MISEDMKGINVTLEKKIKLNQPQKSSYSLETLRNSFLSFPTYLDSKTKVLGFHYTNSILKESTKVLLHLIIIEGRGATNT